MNMLFFSNINKGLEAYRRTENALLVDVREAEEYAAGHIPGAVNVPLSTIAEADLPKDRSLSSPTARLSAHNCQIQLRRCNAFHQFYRNNVICPPFYRSFRILECSIC